MLVRRNVFVCDNLPCGSRRVAFKSVGTRQADSLMHYLRICFDAIEAESNHQGQKVQIQIRNNTRSRLLLEKKEKEIQPQNIELLQTRQEILLNWQRIWLKRWERGTMVFWFFSSQQWRAINGAAVTREPGPDCSPSQCQGAFKEALLNESKVFISAWLVSCEHRVVHTLIKRWYNGRQGRDQFRPYRGGKQKPAGFLNGLQ